MAERDSSQNSLRREECQLGQEQEEGAGEGGKDGIGGSEGKRQRTYSSSSKEEGMGVSPEALAGIGARDMMGVGVVVEDVADQLLSMRRLLLSENTDVNR